MIAEYFAINFHLLIAATNAWMEYVQEFSESIIADSDPQGFKSDEFHLQKGTKYCQDIVVKRSIEENLDHKKSLKIEDLEPGLIRWLLQKKGYNSEQISQLLTLEKYRLLLREERKEFLKAQLPQQELVIVGDANLLQFRGKFIQTPEGWTLKEFNRATVAIPDVEVLNLAERSPARQNESMHLPSQVAAASSATEVAPPLALFSPCQPAVVPTNSTATSSQLPPLKLFAEISPVSGHCPANGNSQFFPLHSPFNFSSQGPASSAGEPRNQLQSAIAAAVKRFIENANKSKFSLRHRHGKTGKLRVESFQKDSAAREMEGLPQFIIDFINNKEMGNFHPSSFKVYLMIEINKALGLGIDNTHIKEFASTQKDFFIEKLTDYKSVDSNMITAATNGTVTMTKVNH